MAFLNNIALFFIIMFLLYSCYSDVFYRQIKNSSVVLVLLCSVITGGCSGSINLLFPFIFLGLGFFLVSFDIIGAGDIKLVFALLPGIPVELAGRFFLLMCLLGIPLAFIALFFSTFIFKQQIRTLPFGVAIAAGYIAMAWRGYV